MYNNVTSERDPNIYPPSKSRENGYHPMPYDEREWSMRTREERDRDYVGRDRYGRLREWSLEREYRPTHSEVSPEPKRRKLRDDLVDSKEYKRHERGYDSPRSFYSRSPSPHSHTSPTEKERYRYFQQERDPLEKPHPYREDYSRTVYRDSVHSSYSGSRSRDWDRDRIKYNDEYRGSHSYGTNGSGYHSYDNEYRDRHYDRDRYRTSNYDKERNYDPGRDFREPIVDHDRERYNYREDYSNDREYDKGSRDTIRDDYDRKFPRDKNDRDKSVYYSPSDALEEDYRPNQLLSPDNISSLSREAKVDQSSLINGYSLPQSSRYDYQMFQSQPSQSQLPSHSHSKLAPSASPTTPVAPTTPQPKRRLAWGQGLLSIEKPKEPEQKEPEGENQSGFPPLLSGTPSLAQRPQDGPSKDFCAPSPVVVDSCKPVVPRDPRVRPTESTKMEVESVSPSNSPNLTIDILPKSTEKPVVIPSTPVEPPKPIPKREPLPSKEEILLSIEKLDSEISKTESQINNLKRPKKEHKHARGWNVNVVQEIYDENKEKIQQMTEEREKFLHPSMKEMTAPLYTKPSDLPEYHQTIATHEKIRCSVLKEIKTRRKELREKEERLIWVYKKLHDGWKKQVEKMEKKRQKKEMKLRKKEILSGEPQSQRRPALRTTPARMQVGFGSPVLGRGLRGDAVRSEVELEAVIAQLREEESRDPNSKYLKTVAKIPPMMLPEHREPIFIDKNGLVEDPMAAERERKLMNPWNDEEKAIFLKKFVAYPKNFTKIATYLPTKSTADVIWYYYNFKRTLDLKKILREQQSKRRGLIAQRKFSTSSSNLATSSNSVGSSSGSNSNSNLPRELANLGVSPGSSYWASSDIRSARIRTITESEEKLNASQATLVTSADGSTDKWTEIEKELFLEGLAKYNTDFKLISQFIATKNSIQVKNYYQNYKKKGTELTSSTPLTSQTSTPTMSKETEEKRGRGRPPKSREKDTKLGTKIEEDEDDEDEDEDEDDEDIGSKRGSGRQMWTEEEKENFLKYFKQHGKNWKAIADQMPTKNTNQIKNFFQYYKTKLNLTSLLNDQQKQEGMTPAVAGKKRGRKPNSEKQCLQTSGSSVGRPPKRQNISKGKSEESPIQSPVMSTVNVTPKTESPTVDSTVKQESPSNSTPTGTGPTHMEHELLSEDAASALMNLASLMPSSEPFSVDTQSKSNSRSVKIETLPINEVQVEDQSSNQQTLDMKSESSLVEVGSSPEMCPKLSVDDSISNEEALSKKENQDESNEQSLIGQSSGSISPESPQTKEESNLSLTTHPISTSESKEDVDSDLVAPQSTEVESGEDTVQPSSSMMEIELTHTSSQNNAQMELEQLVPTLQVTSPLNEKDESSMQRQSVQETSLSQLPDAHNEIQTLDTNLPAYLEGSPQLCSSIHTRQKQKTEQGIETPSSKTEEVDLNSTVKTTDCK